MIKNIRKIFIVIIISVTVFFPNSKSAEAAYSAWVTNDINPVSNMNSILDDLGVDKEEMKYSIQSMNVARQKKQPPQVSLTFDPVDPKPGQKVTVTATPIYFLNDTKDLYFTWYLQTAGCDDNGSLSKCDLNSDGNIDEEDWKIKATRIIVNDGFDWNNEDGGDPTQPNPDIYNGDNDSDGYYSVNGGDDQREKNNSHCYIHDIASGNEYELQGNSGSTCQGRENHLFPDAPGETTGDGSFGLGEERFWRTNPRSSDTANTGNSDEANVTGLGISQFTWTYTAGDKVGVAVEGVSIESTQYKDSSYKIMWAFTKNKCDIDIDSWENESTESTSDPVDTGTGDLCPDGITLQQKITRTTNSRTLVSQINNTLYIRTTTSSQDMIDADCDGTFETAGSSSQTTTCPNYPPRSYNPDDPSSTYMYNGIYCTGLDEERTLDTESSEAAVTIDDLNECLKGNLIEPQEGGGAKEKIDVSLSYLPQNPMNDPGTGSGYNEDGDGDKIIIQSSITNSDDSDYLKYEWQLYESDASNPDSWETILSGRLPDDIITSGIGLDSLSLRLGIPDLKKYLRIKLTVSENSKGTDEIRKGTTDIVIPILDTQQRIKVYNATVSDSLAFSKGATERCYNEETDVPDAICLVPKNEIVAVSVDNNDGLTDFLWTVNNEAIYPPNSQNAYENTAYFPVLKDNGYRYNIKLSATNASGEKVDLTRTFQVADPEIQIASADEFVCKPNLIGHYIDLDGTYWPDYSKNNFSALSDTPIKLKAEFTGFVPTQDQYYWYVDGMEITKSNAENYGYSIDNAGILILPEKVLGESYTVKVGYLFSQNKNTKSALTKYWGVALDKLYEKKISSSIKITFVGSISDAQGAGKNNLSKKIVASVYSSTPSYIAFLMKIVLTAFTMLIFSKIILSFFPNIQKNEY